MVGKLLLLDDELKLKSRHGYFVIDNIKEVENKTIQLIEVCGFVWVEFEIKPGLDSAIVTKFYDLYFGTPKENVSIATERYSKNNYPVGGFIPGFTHRKCGICKNEFIGNEKATQCEICANNL
jgi:hypothetical protein